MWDDTYGISYDKQKNQIIISCFAFTLSIDSVKAEKLKRHRYAFELGTSSILNTVHGIGDGLTSLLRILADLSNIHTDHLVQKFINESDGKRTFEIGF